jgi:hypothetical protein
MQVDAVYQRVGNARLVIGGVKYTIPSVRWWVG